MQGDSHPQRPKEGARTRMGPVHGSARRRNAFAWTWLCLLLLPYLGSPVLRADDDAPRQETHLYDVRALLAAQQEWFGPILGRLLPPPAEGLDTRVTGGYHGSPPTRFGSTADVAVRLAETSATSSSSTAGSAKVEGYEGTFIVARGTKQQLASIERALVQLERQTLRTIQLDVAAVHRGPGAAMAREDAAEREDLASLMASDAVTHHARLLLAPGITGSTWLGRSRHVLAAYEVEVASNGAAISDPIVRLLQSGFAVEATVTPGPDDQQALVALHAQVAHVEDRPPRAAGEERWIEIPDTSHESRRLSGSVALERWSPLGDLGGTGSEFFVRVRILPADAPISSDRQIRIAPHPLDRATRQVFRVYEIGALGDHERLAERPHHLPWPLSLPWHDEPERAMLSPPFPSEMLPDLLVRSVVSDDTWELEDWSCEVDSNLEHLRLRSDQATVAHVDGVMERLLAATLYDLRIRVDCVEVPADAGALAPRMKPQTLRALLASDSTRVLHADVVQSLIGFPTTIRHVHSRSFRSDQGVEIASGTTIADPDPGQLDHGMTLRLSGEALARMERVQVHFDLTSSEVPGPPADAPDAARQSGPARRRDLARPGDRDTPPGSARRGRRPAGRRAHATARPHPVPRPLRRAHCVDWAPTRGHSSVGRAAAF